MDVRVVNFIYLAACSPNGHDSSGFFEHPPISRVVKYTHISAFDPTGSWEQLVFGL